MYAIGNHVKQNKSDSKRQMPYVLSYIDTERAIDRRELDKGKGISWKEEKEGRK